MPNVRDITLLNCDIRNFTKLLVALGYEDFITTCKRSLGQGNICLQVCVCTRGGVPAPRGVPGPGGSGPGGCLVDTPWRATAVGGMYPNGMHSCSIRVFDVKHRIYQKLNVVKKFVIQGEMVENHQLIVVLLRDQNG